MLRISVLGAAGTGKTQLASTLVAALSAPGRPAFLASDSDPASRELHEDTRRQAVLIADNPPLAIAQRLGVQLILLMGLDLPPPDGTGPEREAADRSLRQALAQAQLAYQVIYGVGPQRLQNALGALGALDALLSCPAASPTCTDPDGGGTRAGRPWVWTCDKCSDPQCERRLLSDLLANRAS